MEQELTISESHCKDEYSQTRDKQGQGVTVSLQAASGRAVVQTPHTLGTAMGVQAVLENGVSG